MLAIVPYIGFLKVGLAAGLTFLVVHFKPTLHNLAAHTGLPVVVLAAAIVVLLLRAFRASVRWAVEFAIVLAVLALASHFGWLSL
jgi:hypothetical protein